MSFRKVLEYGNPLPPITHGYSFRRTCVYNDGGQLTGLFSALLYTLDTVPVYQAISSAVNGDVEDAGFRAAIAGSGLVVAYALAASANFFMHKAREHHPGYVKKQSS